MYPLCPSRVLKRTFAFRPLGDVLKSMSHCVGSDCIADRLAQQHLRSAFRALTDLLGMAEAHPQSLPNPRVPQIQPCRPATRLGRRCACLCLFLRGPAMFRTQVERWHLAGNVLACTLVCTSVVRSFGCTWSVCSACPCQLLGSEAGPPRRCTFRSRRPGFRVSRRIVYLVCRAEVLRT